MSTYKAAGVNYEVLDAGKRSALAAAMTTSSLLGLRGGQAHDESRGEPAFLFTLGEDKFALVLECLGTKSIIARKYQEETGVNKWAEIAIDTIGTIVNDIICVGALPLVVNAYFATGNADWYDVPGRYAALVDGWRWACEQSGAVWGGGESPGLSGVINDKETDLAGCAIGRIPPGREPLLGEELTDGDEIVLIASSGMHANGASLARKIAEKLPDSYATKLPSGQTFGDAVLAASVLYVKLVEELLNSDVRLTYVTQITGHGFRKVMRANRELTYRINKLPEVPEVLTFMCEQAGLDKEEAYGTFNMGAGFAVFCKPGSGNDVVAIAEKAGYGALVSGKVEAGPKQVILEPLGITYSEDELQLR